MPMPKRLAWRPEQRIPTLPLPMPTPLAWRLAQQALAIQWDKSSRRYHLVAERPCEWHDVLLMRQHLVSAIFEANGVYYRVVPTP
jgi:hypothetical protein